MIARNERPRLARAIHSIEAVADEIVLVDTGSTDGTPDLARELGARGAFFSWCDDFSAARNRAVSLASQDKLPCFPSGAAEPMANGSAKLRKAEIWLRIIRAPICCSAVENHLPR